MVWGCLYHKKQQWSPQDWNTAGEGPLFLGGSDCGQLSSVDERRVWGHLFTLSSQPSDSSEETGTETEILSVVHLHGKEGSYHSFLPLKTTWNRGKKQPLDQRWGLKGFSEAETVWGEDSNCFRIHATLLKNFIRPHDGRVKRQAPGPK